MISKVDMKRVVTKYIPSLQISVVYKIGINAKNNFELIDEADKNDIWFHLNNESSCHVIACLKNITSMTLDDDVPNGYDLNFDELGKKQKQQIVKQGALLCKQYSRLKSMKNVEIIYTKIENVAKTDIVGTVSTYKSKVIAI
jgi:predicted ribosome quality control (RQC) complex YloA/Tae2 family protein